MTYDDERRPDLVPVLDPDPLGLNKKISDTPEEFPCPEGFDPKVWDAWPLRKKMAHYDKEMS